MTTYKMQVASEEAIDLEKLRLQLEAIGIKMLFIAPEPSPAEPSLQEIFDELDETDHALYQRLA